MNPGKLNATKIVLRYMSGLQDIIIGMQRACTLFLLNHTYIVS